MTVAALVAVILVTVVGAAGLFVVTGRVLRATGAVVVATAAAFLVVALGAALVVAGAGAGAGAAGVRSSTSGIWRFVAGTRLTRRSSRDRREAHCVSH